MNIGVLQAELHQARLQTQRLLQEKEMFTRLTILLSRYITEGQKIPLVDGHVAVPAGDFAQVPKKWSVNVEPAQSKSEDGTEDIPFLVVNVKEKDVLVTPSPALVVPS